jgi:phospholipase/carboxylesterase
LTDFTNYYENFMADISSVQLLTSVEVVSVVNQPVVGAVIWLHGLGSDGNDFVPVVKELKLPSSCNLRFVFPNAPELPITVNGGYVMPAWYDIVELSLDRKIDVAQLRASALQVHALIEREISRGIPSEKIVVAGFSQGGAVAYEAALSFDKTLAGLLTLSTYFATHATIAPHVANAAIPILIQHGSEDSVVDEVLGQRAYRQLTDLGYAVAYESFAMEHTLCQEQIQSISRWLQARF